ncbi:MAG: beta-lactamase family protein [Pseudomonadota bacterium]|nr:beta-lactamase family protein [Pseudomonadota bacterium]
MKLRSAILAAPILLSGCVTALGPASPPQAASHAWISFDRQKVTARGADGLADRSRQRALTSADPVRIASVSKLVVALGVMRLVEQGRLDLDRDVSEVLGWKLRNPSFPDRPITLRLLLSHQSSLRDGIDYAIPLGTELRTALAAPAAYDQEHSPGTYFRYSNLNFPVVASVMELAGGERFDRLMDRLVLAPLGLEACFNWSTCSDATVARAVVLYGEDGAVLRDDLSGRRPACPALAPAGLPCDLSGYRIGSNGALFSPQGGLRISAEGLSVIGRLLLNRGMVNGKRFLSEASIQAMLAPHWRFNGTNGETEDDFYCGYGLAVQILPNPGCRDDILGNATPLVGHAGNAYGVKSGLWIDRRRGAGMAYFATGIAEDAPKGETSYRSIEEWLARRAAQARP